MRTWLTAVVVGFLAGCASNASTPSQGERQALAPTGKLRVALYTGAPASIVQGATLDQSKGVGFDLGKELARRIGVPFEPVVYPSPGAIMVGLKSGEWDLTFFGPTPERDSVLDFTEPLLVIEHGYLVPAGSPISTIDAVDRPGIRIGAPQVVADRVPRHHLERQRRHEARRGVGDDDVHVGAGVAHAAHQLGTLVGGDATSQAEQDAFAVEQTHAALIDVAGLGRNVRKS